MNLRAPAALAAFLVAPTFALAEITFYEFEGFRGRSFTVTEDVRNFDRHGFNDKAQSAYVAAGRWEVCTDARFEGECRILRRGSYDSLRSLDMAKRISSVRRVETQRSGREVAPPLAEPDYAYHRRPREQVFEARVISVREVHGTAERHCWMETDSSQSRSGQQVGAAVVGALIGGVLGHQVGGGRGKDAATAAGAVAGAALASRAAGGSYGNTHERQVQRCETRGGKPAYWDVRYEFDGAEHYAQMSAPPGRTVLVNERGEPRQ
jgi:uncharacterized protein YcfJ